MYGGASQHSSYSPTNVMNPSQTPSYSPTTPNYVAGMTPIQHSTPTYTYGGPTSGAPAYQMPNLSSPSMNPASSSPMVSMGSGGNSSPHMQGSYGQSPAAYGGTSGYHSGNTPLYSAPSPGRPTVPTAPAYNPEAAAKEDSSDSDD